MTSRQDVTFLFGSSIAWSLVGCRLPDSTRPRLQILEGADAHDVFSFDAWVYLFTGLLSRSVAG